MRFSEMKRTTSMCVNKDVAPYPVKYAGDCAVETTSMA